MIALALIGLATAFVFVVLCIHNGRMDAADRRKHGG